MLVHGTCVEIDGHGVLLQGPSGSGKSDLALRLIDEGACLVADDQVILSVQENVLKAGVPSTIAGLMEVRGIGIVRMPFVASVSLCLAVALVPGAMIERLPEPSFSSFLEHAIPRIEVDPFTASAAAKVRLVVYNAVQGIMPS